MVRPPQKPKKSYRSRVRHEDGSVSLPSGKVIDAETRKVRKSLRGFYEDFFRNLP